MKVAYEHNEITTNIETRPVLYAIANDPVAFDILSNRLYTNKIRAVIREICCNAWDAHLKTGNTETPFKVQLPTCMDLNFIVRDFGPGLSPTAILELYTTYFGSDKRENNELIGGLGLGSKSPMAYTSAYTVISYHKNNKYTYSCFKGVDLRPNILLINEESTDEPSGLEVIVPAEPHDVWRFETEADFILPWFPKYECNYHAKNKQWVHKTATWGLLEDPNASCIRVIQGHVEYRVDYSAIKNHPALSATNPVTNFKGGLVLFTPIGSLSVAASRENLSLDPVTFNKLGNMVIEAYGNFHSWLQEEVNKQPSAFTAAKFVHDVHTRGGFAGLPPIFYRGNRLHLSMFMEMVIPEELRTAITEKKLSIDLYRANGRGNFTKDSSYTDNISFSFKTNPTIYFTNIPIGTKTIAKELNSRHSTRTSVFVITCTDDTFVEPLNEFFENLPFTDLSFLRQTTHGANGRIRSVTSRPYTPVSCKILDYLYQQWRDYETKTEEHYYQVPLFKGKIGPTGTILDQITGHPEFYNLITKFWDARLQKIIGVQASTPKRLQPNDSQTSNFSNNFLTLLQTRWDHYDPIIRTQVNHSTDVYSYLIPLINPILNQLDPTKPLAKYVREINDREKLYNEQLDLNWFRDQKFPELLGLPNQDCSPDEVTQIRKNLVREFNDLIPDYPILGLLPDDYHSTDTISFFHSLNLKGQVRAFQTTLLQQDLTAKR